ncbi:NADPH-dependent FMN reductase [Streptomyces lavendulae]|uniref:NADPH-dependent FMN reductase n=1 Tax=Streptomyces lavendulae TaxID=1914 RepID=UPI0036AAEC4B
MPTPPVILLLSGSLRAGSSNDRVLRTARAVADQAPEPLEAVLYEGPRGHPHNTPHTHPPPLPPRGAARRPPIRGAAAVLVCTPEYAGTLPGSFKNLLDWTVGGTEICDKPVAWVNAAAPGRGEGAAATLRTVLGYTGAAVVEEACVRVPAGGGEPDADGLLTDPAARESLARVLALLAAAARETGRA